MVIDSLKGSGDQLVDNFSQFIGKYKTFHDFPNFDLQRTEDEI